MPSYQWIQHKGKRILFMDIGVTESEALRERIATIEPVVEKEQPNSIYCVCSVAGGKSSPEMTLSASGQHYQAQTVGDLCAVCHQNYTYTDSVPFEEQYCRGQSHLCRAQQNFHTN